MKMKKKIHRNGMKKTGKRIVALFLAMVLAFGNAGTVLATEESETENVAEEAEKTTEVPKEEIEKEEEIKEEETETESTEADKPENSEAKEVQRERGKTGDCANARETSKRKQKCRSTVRCVDIWRF